MNNTAADQTAYRIGEVIGALMVLVIFVGIVVFFIIALIKAISTRKTGWIIAASLTSVPFILFFVLMCVGFVVGFKRGLNHTTDMANARQGRPSELLTADMTPVTGNAMAYQVSLPSVDSWAKSSEHSPFDYLFSYNEAYVGIIAEDVGLKTPQRVCDLSQKNISSKAPDVTFTVPQPIEIDSRSWLTFDASATIKDIPIKYRFYDYADTNYTIQIITWTLPPLFDHDAPVFDRVAKSFKLPND